MNNVRLNVETLEEGRDLPRCIYRRQDKQQPCPAGTVEVFSVMLANMQQQWHIWNCHGQPVAKEQRLEASIEFTTWAIAAAEMLLHKDEERGVPPLASVQLGWFLGTLRDTPPETLLADKIRDYMSMTAFFIADVINEEPDKDRRTLAQRLQLALVVADIRIKLTDGLEHAGVHARNCQVCARGFREEVLSALGKP